MIKKLLVLTALIIWTTSGAAHAEQEVKSVKDIDSLIKRLEESGALNRAIERYFTRQQEQERKHQQDELAKQSAMAKNARSPDPGRDHLLGTNAADVTIIEYIDFECPYCKAFHGTPQEVVKRLSGKVNMVWRHFPLDFHNPAALNAAEASVCAAKVGGNKAFWKYADAVIMRTEGNGKGMPATNGNPLSALAKELNIDPVSFQKCLDTGVGKQKVAEDEQDGKNSGINGTPGVIVRNNKTGKSVLMTGAVPLDKLENQVRELLRMQ